MDSRLIEYASTPLQRERLEAWQKHGSQEAAARALGCDSRAIRKAYTSAKKRAARAGYAPGHFTSGVAPGNVMGKVTIQRNADGEIERTWERQGPDGIDWTQTIEDLLAGMIDTLPAAEPKPCEMQAEDLLYVVPIGDAHFGSYAWEGETGERYDLDIAKERHRGGVDALIDAAPACKKIVLINLGDFFDSNCSKNRTPRSGNVMDPSGTYNEILEAACQTTVYMIDRALEKGEEVEYAGLEGNHDPEASAALCAFVFAWYRNEPRVTCNLRPHIYWYLKWGKNLLGAHHGHGCKPGDLPGVMAVDCRADWGSVEHCHWLIGHFHHRS